MTEHNIIRKHFIYVLSILVMFAGGLAGCKKTSDAIVSTGTISGKYNPPGAAAGAVALKVSGTVIVAAKLDSNNGFSFTGLEAGIYKIIFSASSGFIAPDTISVTVVAGVNTDMGTVVFKPTGLPGGGTGSITGKISPAKGAVNILAAGVFGNPRYSAMPDANGNFKIDSIAPGDYVVSATAATGFVPPNNVVATVTAGANTDIGGLVFKLIVVVPKAIDTITGTVFLSSAQAVNEFITRANADSAIVMTGLLWLTAELTPELSGGLNKIIAIKQGLYFGNATATSLSLNSLKELGQLYINGSYSLTSLDLTALKTITGGILMYGCPLANLKIDALNEFAGSLVLRGTDLRDLSAFRSAMYKPFSLDIGYNGKLTSLTGLNFASDSVYDCTITANPLLTSLNGLQGIKRFKNETLISDNPVLQTLSGLDNIIVAKQLTLTNNLQLNMVCGAKQLINILKDAPPYQKSHIDQNTGQTVFVTMQPLVASGNGGYATRADLVSAIGQCP